jgi:catechol 2,3-dioxygenase
MKPHHLGHVHLKVSDLNRAEEFYTKMLGLKVTERVDDEFIFLTLGTHHHDVALMNVGKNAPRPPARGTGLFHFAFEVATTKDFAAFYKRLKEAGIIPTTVDYGISKAMYIPDPDHNIIEIYVDTREERRMWQGRTELLQEEKILSYLKET